MLQKHDGSAWVRDSVEVEDVSIRSGHVVILQWRAKERQVVRHAGLGRESRRAR
jgi:hypothetical protein